MTKDTATRVPRREAGERHHDEKAGDKLRLASHSPGYSPVQRLGRQFKLSEDDFGGAV